jgi:hypothetical protein
VLSSLTCSKDAVSSATLRNNAGKNLTVPEDASSYSAIDFDLLRKIFFYTGIDLNS